MRLVFPRFLAKSVILWMLLSTVAAVDDARAGGWGIKVKLLMVEESKNSLTLTVALEENSTPYLGFLSPGPDVSTCDNFRFTIRDEQTGAFFGTLFTTNFAAQIAPHEIGRASCRERV